MSGTSLVPVLNDPANGVVKDETLSQFPRCWQNNTHHSGGKPGDENNRTRDNIVPPPRPCKWALSRRAQTTFIQFILITVRYVAGVVTVAKVLRVGSPCLIATGLTGNT